jgi:hypothetical protein
MSAGLVTRALSVVPVLLKVVKTAAAASLVVAVSRITLGVS